MKFLPLYDVNFGPQLEHEARQAKVNTEEDHFLSTFYGWNCARVKHYSDNWLNISDLLSNIPFTLMNFWRRVRPTRRRTDHVGADAGRVLTVWHVCLIGRTSEVRQFRKRSHYCRLGRDGCVGRSAHGVWKDSSEGVERGGVRLNTQPLWVDGQWHPKHFLPPREHVQFERQAGNLRHSSQGSAIIGGRGPEEHRAAWLFFIWLHVLGHRVLSVHYFTTYVS